jgi:hypothetical protein
MATSTSTRRRRRSSVDNERSPWKDDYDARASQVASPTKSLRRVAVLVDDMRAPVTIWNSPRRRARGRRAGSHALCGGRDLYLLTTAGWRWSRAASYGRHRRGCPERGTGDRRVANLVIGAALAWWLQRRTAAAASRASRRDTQPALEDGK